MLRIRVLDAGVNICIGVTRGAARIKNETEANDLWAYLAQFDKDGKKK